MSAFEWLTLIEAAAVVTFLALIAAAGILAGRDWLARQDWVAQLRADSAERERESLYFRQVRRR